MTLCGHSATVQEFRRMKFIKLGEVTCKRCLNIKERMESKELDSADHNDSIKIAAKT
jgi:hypothetical protein